MFALPAVPQDFAIEPRSPFSVAAEVRSALAPAVEQAVSATIPAEYDAALEELVEHPDLPPVPVDLNKVFSAFGPASPLFVQSLGEFAQMRQRLGPYAEAPDLRRAVILIRDTVFSGRTSLEWSRLIVDFIESTVGLAALFTALHHGQTPSRFFTRTLAERSLQSTRSLRLYLETAARRDVVAEIPASTTAKLDEWTAKSVVNGIHRPFGDHVD